MADFTHIAGGLAVPPNNYNPTFAVALIPGTPVIASAAAVVNKAQANAAATARCIGVVSKGAGALARGEVQYVGPLELTAAEWDATAGTEGGLVTGTEYYVSAATAGKLTGTAPASPNYVYPVGVAVSPTCLMIGARNPVVGA